MHGTSTHAPMPSMPFPATDFDPLAELSRMAARRDDVEDVLKAEWAKPNPAEAVVEACQTWLRVYDRERSRLAASTSERLRRAAEDRQ